MDAIGFFFISFVSQSEQIHFMVCDKIELVTIKGESRHLIYGH